jgi:hypothetical protein
MKYLCTLRKIFKLAFDMVNGGDKNMKKIRKPILLAIALAIVGLMITSTASTPMKISTNSMTMDKPMIVERIKLDPYTKLLEGSTPADIQDYRYIQPVNTILAGENILVSDVDDDILPSICTDLDGHTVVTYTNQPSFSEGYMGISWSDTPTDPMSWQGWIITITGDDMFFDTALIQGPEPDDYKDLMGVYMQMSDEFSGYYLISDITSDVSEWLFYNWQGGAPEPEYACISDMGFYQDLYYPDMWGPFNFYIYHEIYSTYDIPSCPICFHTDVRGGTGGVGFFDGQSFELTAPASDPDIVDLGDHFHTAIQYTNTTTGPHIVWKKIVPSEEPDYEFTPYQDTVADGENPTIAAYEDGGDYYVAIAYVDGNDVKCIYSDDDGDTWSNPVTVAPGSYPDIYAVGTTFYCAYIDGGNLYLKTSDTGGASWSAAEQINEVDGTVVAEENAVDMHAAGVVWVDERGNDYDIYYASIAGEPPSAPVITGETNGAAGTSYDYDFTATDPDGDDVQYYIDWGDDNTEWTSFAASGTPVTASHTWDEQGDYIITAKAKDINGLIGPEGTLPVTMPVNLNQQSQQQSIFIRFVQMLQNLFVH